MLLTKVAPLFDETPVADAIDPANFAINVEHIAAAAGAATIKGSTIERSSTGATIANGDDVLLKMDLAAGHFSASDRYRYLRELAFDFAWLLDKLGTADSIPKTK